MYVDFNEVKEIVDTLPIGLYSRRRVPCELTKEDKSFYEGKTDTIKIGYHAIAGNLANIKEENYTKENAIRSNVYHELSHAILTPNELKDYRIGHIDEDIFNIFEDERIETILDNFYLDVDFKKNCLMANGGEVKNPTSVDEAFFNLVRYRICNNKNFLTRVEEIIEKYADINASYSLENYEDRNKFFNYVEEIKQLYSDFKKHYNFDKSFCENSEEELEQMTQFLSSGMGNGEGATSDIDGQGEKINSSETNENDTKETSNGDSGEEETSNGDSGEEETSNENANKTLKRGMTSGRGREELKDFFTKGLSAYKNSSLTATLEGIISQFNKKNKGGSGITSYSGVFNPRLVGNDDYRYFERSMSCNGNNRFGKFHLNLYIDNSGSFANNAIKVNTLINSLTEIEQRNKNFSFDVILCGNGMKETTKNNRWVLADEGTYADYKQAKEIFKKHNNLKDILVRNILMYDGPCSYNSSLGNPFKVFDTNNSTIIVERGNFNATRDLKTANVIRINDRTYTERFIDEVVKSISNAFR